MPVNLSELPLQVWERSCEIPHYLAVPIRWPRGFWALCEAIEAAVEGDETSLQVIIEERAGRPDSVLDSALVAVLVLGLDVPITYLTSALVYHRRRLATASATGQARWYERQAERVDRRLRKPEGSRLTESLRAYGGRSEQLKRLADELRGAILSAEAEGHILTEQRVFTSAEIPAVVERRIYRDNRSLGQTRKRREDHDDIEREAFDSLDMMPESAPGAFSDPAAVAAFEGIETLEEAAEVAAWIERAGLSEGQRRTLDFRIRGFSSKEIADLEGTTANAVDQRLHRIRARLGASLRNAS